MYVVEIVFTSIPTYCIKIEWQCLDTQQILWASCCANETEDNDYIRPVGHQNFSFA